MTLKEWIWNLLFQQVFKERVNLIRLVLLNVKQKYGVSTKVIFSCRLIMKANEWFTASHVKLHPTCAYKFGMQEMNA